MNIDHIRTNQSFWGTSSDNHIWGADAGTNNTFSINNNSGQAVTSGGAIKAGILGISITDGQVLFNGSTSNFSNSDFGALLRFNDSNNWYKAYIDGSNLLIRRNLNGNNIVLIQTPFSASGNTSYSLRFQVIGATLQAKVWPTNMSEPTNWMLSATDYSFSSGFAGIQVSGNGGVVTYTSFSAYQL